MITYLLMDIVVIVSLACGLFFMFVGAVGVVHLPDFYNRMHAASKCSTLGVMGLVIALIFSMGSASLTTRAVIAVIFTLLATPVGSHILSKAALRIKTPLWEGTLSNDHDESTSSK